MGKYFPPPFYTTYSLPITSSRRIVLWETLHRTDTGVTCAA
jgi:hypothetical protein